MFINTIKCKLSPTIKPRWNTANNKVNVIDYLQPLVPALGGAWTGCLVVLLAVVTRVTCAEVAGVPRVESKRLRNRSRYGRRHTCKYEREEVGGCFIACLDSQGSLHRQWPRSIRKKRNSQWYHRGKHRRFFDHVHCTTIVLCAWVCEVYRESSEHRKVYNTRYSLYIEVGWTIISNRCSGFPLSHRLSLVKGEFTRFAWL